MGTMSCNIHTDKCGALLNQSALTHFWAYLIWRTPLCRPRPLPSPRPLPPRSLLFRKTRANIPNVEFFFFQYIRACARIRPSSVASTETQGRNRSLHFSMLETISKPPSWIIQINSAGRRLPRVKSKRKIVEDGREREVGLTRWGAQNLRKWGK